MINQKQSRRIAMIGDSLAGGGAERVHALLSVYFSSKGFDVHNCIFVDDVGYEFKGTLLNLGKIRANSNAFLRKTARFKALREFISSGNFDHVIDFRMRPGFFQEWLIAKFIYPKNTFYTVHSGVLPFYFPPSASLSRLIYKNKSIVAVSNAIGEAIIRKRLAANVATIHNPVNIGEISKAKNLISADGKYIIAVGRMNDGIKQTDKLIMAYSKSTLPKLGIALKLVGDGAFRPEYQSLATEFGVGSMVYFEGFVKNPFPYYTNALFTVLSSKNEGFPNVLIESLACGTPVVSFDCFSGPSEIVIDRRNGLLVRDQDFAALTQAMDEMVKNNELYTVCKLNSRESVSQFDIEIIGKKWLDILKYVS